MNTVTAEIEVLVNLWLPYMVQFLLWLLQCCQFPMICQGTLGLVMLNEIFVVTSILCQDILIYVSTI